MTYFVKQRALFFIITLFFVLVFLLLPKACFAESITVELIWKFPEPGWLEIEVRQGVYHLKYDQSILNLSPGDSLKIGQSALAECLFKDNRIEILQDPVVRISNQSQGIFRVREPGKDWVSYRGNLMISKEGMAWRLSNVLEREDYLKGVVPIEMSNAWAAKGFEALKAQAVAARTYLLRNMDSKGRITDSPNIHQAYWGRSVEGEATRAVEVTSGEILADADTRQPISIFYSSHNGGYSEETQNVWQSHDPHYVSEPDDFSQGIGGYVDQWRFLIAADTLGNSFGLSPIREVKLKRYVSGRVYEVELLDWLGNGKSVTGGEFVRKFYPYDRGLSKDSFLGKLFQVDYIFPDLKETEKLPLTNLAGSRQMAGDSIPGPILARLKSSNEGLSDKPRPFGVFVFNGRGWGHGVGMSQWGAYNMAVQGYSYEDILSNYYKNTILVKR